MCQEKKLIRAKLTKGKFKAYLVPKYGGIIADKIQRVFNDAFKRGSLDFTQYCNYFE